MRIHTQTGVWAGAVAGTVLFLAAGLLPSLLYGGYLGVVVGSALVGGPIEPGGFGGLAILMGMLVGAVSTWFLFLVAGASAGALATWGAAKAVSGRTATEADDSVRTLKVSRGGS